jgi:hypothetical protein
VIRRVFRGAPPRAVREQVAQEAAVDLAQVRIDVLTAQLVERDAQLAQAQARIARLEYDRALAGLTAWFWRGRASAPPPMPPAPPVRRWQPTAKTEVFRR